MGLLSCRQVGGNPDGDGGEQSDRVDRASVPFTVNPSSQVETSTSTTVSYESWRTVSRPNYPPKKDPTTISYLTHLTTKRVVSLVWSVWFQSLSISHVDTEVDCSSGFSSLSSNTSDPSVLVLWLEVRYSFPRDIHRKKKRKTVLPTGLV